MYKNQSTGDELGVYVFRRASDGVTITIVHNLSATAMYGPQGRVFYPSLQRALLFARTNGFDDVSSFTYL